MVSHSDRVKFGGKTKPGGIFDKYIFLKVAVEEGCFDAEVKGWKIFLYC